MRYRLTMRPFLAFLILHREWFSALSGNMAPKQIRGEAADPRADIFFFGTTLYEMLAGRQPFKGASSVQTMIAILKDEPSEIVPTSEQEILPALRSIVRHCLEKDRNQRFQSAKDLTFALSVSGSGITKMQTEAAFHRSGHPKRMGIGDCASSGSSCDCRLCCDGGPAQVEAGGQC